MEAVKFNSQNLLIDNNIV